ncbi:MAG: rod shape-determining protein MreD [Pelagibacterales bacterium MED-G44]|nr:MAG: rod shape-determining protein MreD [Pelagibacterales bacterium MED-G44]
MNYFEKSGVLKYFFKLLPLIILFIAVLNEFDANYFGIPFLSFNLAFILIFFWTLKNIEYFGYGFIFLAGIINDVVTGTPLGLSSFLYMLICGATAYFRKITLRPNITKDWLFFLVTISCVNSIYYIISSYFFDVSIDYRYLLTNNLATFLIFFLFYIIFNIYFKKFFRKSDV